MYPKAARAVRALLRKRTQLVQHTTTHGLRIQTLCSRNPGHAMRSNRIKPRTAEDVDELLPEPELALAVTSHLAVMRGLDTPMAAIAHTVPQRVKRRAACQDLRTVRGMGQILARTIRLETGDIRRFPAGGNCASYGRWVGSQKRSNGKRTGSGNTQNGHKSLAWAFVEAAPVAVRSHPCLKRFSQRKPAKTNTVVATKAVAHQWARACLYI
jgi:transposase